MRGMRLPESAERACPHGDLADSLVRCQLEICIAFLSDRTKPNELRHFNYDTSRKPRGRL